MFLVDYLRFTPKGTRALESYHNAVNGEFNLAHTASGNQREETYTLTSPRHAGEVILNAEHPPTWVK